MRRNCINNIENLLSQLKICYDNLVLDLSLDESKTTDFNLNGVLEAMMKTMQLISRVHTYWLAKTDKELQ